MKLSQRLFPRLAPQQPKVVARRWLILLLWLVVFARLTQKEPGSWNDASNINTIDALVRHHTWAIDRRDLPHVTGDRAKIRGRLYSARPPVLAFIGACVYAPLHALGWDFHSGPSNPLTAYVVTLLTSGLASAGALTLLWMLLRQLGMGATQATVAAVLSGVVGMMTVFNDLGTAAGLLFIEVYGLAQARRTGDLSRGGAIAVGTLLTAVIGACVYALRLGPAGPLMPYQVVTLLTSGLLAAVMLTLFWMLLQQLGMSSAVATVAMVSLGAASMLTVYTPVFNHHSTAASLAFIGLYGLAQARLTGALSWTGALGIGLALGLAATIDLAGGGLFLLVLGPLAVANATVRRRFLPFAAGVFGAAALHVILNYQITGDAIPALVRPSYFQYSGSPIPLEGLSGVTSPKSLAAFLDYAGGILFGWRGLLVFYPMAVPALWATVELVRRRHPLWRELGLAGLAGVLHTAYLCVFTNNYAGACYGVRWFVLEVPFWYLVVWIAFAEYLGWLERALVLALTAYSGFIAWKGLHQGAWQTQPFPAKDSALRFWMWGACAIVAVVMTVGMARRTRRAAQ